MDELLRSNEKAAIIGDDEGKFHIESKPEEMTHRDWNRWLRSHYREPGYWHDNEEGVPLHYLVGSDFSDGGNLVARFEARIEPYKVFSHESSGLCVRAVFLPHSHSEFFRWVVGVKEDTVN